jgi:hypothetical protein
VIGFVTAALLVVVAVVVEIALPGRDVYHAGWYNVGLIAVVGVILVTGRKRFRKARTVRARLAMIVVILGAAASGVAGAASGLLGADNQTVVGAPGQRVPIETLGVLAFPLAGVESSVPAGVSLERPFHTPMQIGVHSLDAGNFILNALPRDVAYVEARDAHGNRLTVTQPMGAVFLSPVLLMQHRQTIAGLDLPYDSFNVPAARRVVKAVLFTPAQAAMVLRGQARFREAAVLFAVDDENDRLLPHAIALSAGGRSVFVGGLMLRGTVESYPAVEIFSAPNLAVTAIGALLVLGGTIALLSQLLSRDDRPDVA